MVGAGCGAGRGVDFGADRLSRRTRNLDAIIAGMEEQCGAGDGTLGGVADDGRRGDSAGEEELLGCRDVDEAGAGGGAVGLDDADVAVCGDGGNGAGEERRGCLGSCGAAFRRGGA